MKKASLGKSIVFILSLVLFSIIFIRPTYAENDISITFNVAPSLKLNLEGDLTIENLQPGLCDISNQSTIHVYTNNSTGYTLTATAGNASNPTTDLKHSLSTVTSKFSMLSIGANQSELGAGYWGYSLNNGATYSGLPLYTDTANITIISSSTTPAEDNIDINIGACAEAEKIAGTYSNVINFIAVTNYAPEQSINNENGEQQNAQQAPKASQANDQSGNNYSSFSSFQDNQSENNTKNDNIGNVAPLGVYKETAGSTAATTETSTNSNLTEVVTAASISIAVGISVFFILKDKNDDDEKA